MTACSSARVITDSMTASFHARRRVYSCPVKARTVRAIAAAATLVAASGAADAPRTAFGVGVLRRDGVIIPFAAFDGKRWSSPWPAPQRDLTVPVTLSGFPSRWWGPTGPLEQWQATTAGGRRKGGGRQRH